MKTHIRMCRLRIGVEAVHSVAQVEAVACAARPSRLQYAFHRRVVVATTRPVDRAPNVLALLLVCCACGRHAAVRKPRSDSRRRPCDPVGKRAGAHAARHRHQLAGAFVRVQLRVEREASRTRREGRQGRRGGRGARRQAADRASRTGDRLVGGCGGRPAPHNHRRLSAGQRVCLRLLSPAAALSSCVPLAAHVSERLFGSIDTSSSALSAHRTESH